MQDEAPPVPASPAHPQPALTSLSPRKTGLSRRRLLIGGVGLIGLSASATGAYAGAIEPSDLLVTRYALTPPNWPAGRKLTIAVIADLHAGGPHMTLPHIAHIVDTTNALHCDVVVLLGDFKAYYKFNFMPVDDPLWAGELGRLRAPLGVWSILGNHDWWHDLKGVRSALADVRIPILENNAVLLGPPGQKFWLAGIGDQLAHWIGRGQFRGVDDLPGTLARVHTDDPVVLLVHEPDIFTQVPPRVALTLAGHTHGGQIRVPFIWPQFVPSDYGARFAYGHIVEDNRHMIVSGGLGTSVIPARLGVPPEILHVTLGA
ncbi:MAG: metallophosphoesterase [Xanthobacteraceae bacterium]